MKVIVRFMRRRMRECIAVYMFICATAGLLTDDVKRSIADWVGKGLNSLFISLDYPQIALYSALSLMVLVVVPFFTLMFVDLLSRAIMPSMSSMVVLMGRVTSA